MTFSEIETRVRYLVNDNVEPYRFARADVWKFAVDAVRELRSIRPCERYSHATGLIDDALPDSSTAKATDDLRFDPRFSEAVVAYVGFRIYQLDMADTANLQIAETLRDRAETIMKTL